MPVPLVIYYKQLGDVLLLEPALARLAAANDTEVMLATRPGFAPMVNLMERVRPVQARLPGRVSQVISFDPLARACIQSLIARTNNKRLIVARTKQLRPWHGVFFPTERRVLDDSSLYRAEYFFNAITSLPAIDFRPPRLRRPPREWLPDNLPEHYVLLHPTSAWPSKSWSAEAWAITLDALHESGIGPFVVTGGNAPWEVEYVRSIAALTRAPLVDLCGKTSMAGYLGTIANASMALCIDGSAAHLAAAFERPVLALFGPSHPLHWHYPSPGSVCIDARVYCSERKPAVSHIPAGVVIDTAIELWNSTR